MPMPVEALPCGSRSTTSTRYPRSASEAPKLTAVVDLPTPPFWLAIAMMRATPGASGGTGMGRGFFFPRSECLALDAMDRPPLEVERVEVPGAAPTPAEALVTAEP